SLVRWTLLTGPRTSSWHTLSGCAPLRDGCWTTQTTPTMWRRRRGSQRATDRRTTRRRCAAGSRASCATWRSCADDQRSDARRGVDAEAGGDRRRWALALTPIAEKAAPSDAAATGGAGLLKIGGAVVFAAVVALLALGVTRAVQRGSWALRPTGNSPGGVGSW